MESFKTKILREAAKKGVGMQPPAPDSDQDEDSQTGRTATKKVAAGLSSRLEAKKAPPKAKPSKKRKDSGGSTVPPQDEAESDEATAVNDTNHILPDPALKDVVEELRNTPKCFLNLSVCRVLAGERLMRSVDAAGPLFYGTASVHFSKPLAVRPFL